MGKTREKLQENIFTFIGKAIASTLLRKELSINDAMKDPDLRQTIESLEYHSKRFEDQINTLCTRFPFHSRCKDRKRGK